MKYEKTHSQTHMNTYTGTNKKPPKKQKEKTNVALIHQTESKASGQFAQSGCDVWQIQKGLTNDVNGPAPEFYLGLSAHQQLL